MVTIFTPTYNRAGLLNRIYNSLKSQTNPNSEWVIVDDGSVDDTKTVVQQWIDEAVIKIKYVYQENRGKHFAFNQGVKNASGELFFCVDSDDYLPEHCVDEIIDAFNSVKDDKIAGIIGLKTDIDENLLSEVFPVGVAQTTMYELVNKYKCYGEKSLIFKTDILRKYPYPEIKNEKFIGECVVYDKIDKDYEMLVINKVLTVCEYQPDGLTNRIFINMLKNPTGYKIYYKQRIDMACSLKERIGYIIRYNAFNILSKDNEYDYNGKYNVFVKFLEPIGWLLTKYYNKRKNI